jgi:hypothetical protein
MMHGRPDLATDDAEGSGGGARNLRKEETEMLHSKARKAKLFGATAIAAAAMAVVPTVFGSQLWTTNTAKQRLLKGETIVAKRIDSADPAAYCAIASTPGTHFTWVDTTGSPLDYAQAWDLWASSCPSAVAKMRGAEVYYRDRVDPISGAIPEETEDGRPKPPPKKVGKKVRSLGSPELTPQEIQKATDGGAMVLLVPVNTAFEAARAVNRTYYPPTGARSVGPGQAPAIYSDVTADYRGTFNDNVVLIAIVSTVEGAANAKAIAKVEGIHALFVDAMELESSSGYLRGSKDYEKLAGAIRDGAEVAKKHFCTADRSASPHTLTCVKAHPGKK